MVASVEAPPTRSWSAHWAALLLGMLVLSTSGCPSVTAPLAQPPEYEPVGQRKCSVAASSNEPLIVEWPGAQRAKLEALARHGAVVVSYRGCEMQLLGGCRVRRSYEYTPTTHHRERVTIRNADELYARLPLGAASLETELGKGGELIVDMTIVGTYAMSLGTVHEDELEGDCGQATHVVRALTVGAFEFYSAGRASVGLGAEVSEVGGGVRSEASRTLLRQGGEPSECAHAGSDTSEPPSACAALLRVEVERIGPRIRQPEVAATGTAEPPPPATDTTAEPLPEGPEPAPAETTPPTTASTGEDRPGEDSAPAPSTADGTEEGSADWEIYAYVIGGVVLAGLVVVAVVGAVAADDDDDAYVPEAGGFGEVTVGIRWPVAEW